MKKCTISPNYNFFILPFPNNLSYKPSELETVAFLDQVRFKLIVNMKNSLISTLSQRSKNKLIRHGFKQGKYEEVFTIEIEHKLADTTSPDQETEIKPVFEFKLTESGNYRATVRSKMLVKLRQFGNFWRFSE